MADNISFWLIVAVSLVLLDVFVAIRLFYVRENSKRNDKSSNLQKKILIDASEGRKSLIKKKVSISQYFIIKKSVMLEPEEYNNILDTINVTKYEKRYIRRIKSKSRIKRIEAVKYLGAIGSARAIETLETQMKREHDSTVKLYIANELSDIGNPGSINVLIESLYGAGRFYRTKVNMLIADFGDDFHEHIYFLKRSNSIEIKELIVDFASVYFSRTLKDYLISIVDERDETVKELSKLYGESGLKACRNCKNGSFDEESGCIICRYKNRVEPSYYCRRYQVIPVSVNYSEAYYRLVEKACNIIADNYPKVFADSKFLDSEDDMIRNIAVRAQVNFQSPDKLEILIGYIRDEKTARSASNALSTLVERNPALFANVTAIFSAEKDNRVKKELARVLALRVEYFILMLNEKSGSEAAGIIKEILLLGRSSEIIDFLNKNRDLDIENSLIAVIKEVFSESEDLKMEFAQYLEENLVEKCGLKSIVKEEKKEVRKTDKKMTVFLGLILFVVLLIIPLIFVIRRYSLFDSLSPLELIKIFVMDFNYYIAFYSMAINTIYLILLLFSYLNVKKQEKLWKIKDNGLLFKKRMLPSISIIAPAFNEAKTIVESTESMMNLKYPDYELVVVNDGSSDSTLASLIKHYDLKRVDYIYSRKLDTKNVRGIYVNRNRPKLIVVDKFNGGKADSLNVGINFARKEYVCGIDADSLLEEDSLLKIASLTLDEEKETPALGGNIMPANGCIVESGHLIKTRLSDNHLAGFQTIEYIRAFMAGRLGWSYLNSLLIISGAFGLFRKERLITIGGYLTSSGKYRKDTVGEDMELVVRISRQMKESDRDFKILYAYNANCWTEVPEDIKTLKRQRYRWHRGLLEIIYMHRKMIFNPVYGRTGMLAMPYFFVFEMMGPIFETEGYIMIILSAFFGILNYEIAAILFISVVLMGILVSISSLIISEKNSKCFSPKELIALVSYAVIENFGVRQFFGIWRFTGYIRMFKKSPGWQKSERKGFAIKKN